MPASIINHYSQQVYLVCLHCTLTLTLTLTLTVHLTLTLTLTLIYLYQLIFLEKYISIPTMTNNPTLPISSEKSC